MSIYALSKYTRNPLIDSILSLYIPYIPFYYITWSSSINIQVLSHLSWDTGPCTTYPVFFTVLACGTGACDWIILNTQPWACWYPSNLCPPKHILCWLNGAAIIYIKIRLIWFYHKLSPCKHTFDNNCTIMAKESYWRLYPTKRDLWDISYLPDIYLFPVLLPENCVTDSNTYPSSLFIISTTPPLSHFPRLPLYEPDWHSHHIIFPLLHLTWNLGASIKISWSDT